VEFPITEKFTLHASGGLALGLINANASWSETVAGVYSRSGGGHNAAMLYGFYVGADALYQINNRWGVDAGVQYQDLGIYNHDFGGESAVLDLRQSIFVKIGLSFNF
jgi:opacity protein-like surface antigen